MTENTLGIAVRDCGHLGYSRVGMEMQADEHVAFSTHRSSLMWNEKKRESKAKDQLHFMDGGLLVEGDGLSCI